MTPRSIQIVGESWEHRWPVPCTVMYPYELQLTRCMAPGAPPPPPVTATATGDAAADATPAGGAEARLDVKLDGSDRLLGPDQ